MNQKAIEIRNYSDPQKGLIFYSDALEKVIEADYKVPCAVYTSDGYDATGPISGAGYYIDGPYLCYGEYYMKEKKYHKLTKIELLSIKKHHNELEEKFVKAPKKR